MFKLTAGTWPFLRHFCLEYERTFMPMWNQVLVFCFKLQRKVLVLYICNACTIYGCKFPNTVKKEPTNLHALLTSILNIGFKDDLMSSLVKKKNSAETHVSSPFITEQVIGYDMMLEDQEHSVTVLLSSVYHVPFCFDFFPPLPVSSAELSTTSVCSLM